jgi:phospholipid/cholesterol/gamma-HCH transport system substrate-binding protein
VKVTKEFKIGIVVVCAITAFIWGISFLKGSNLFSNRFYLYAIYPKIDNLIPSNPVQINGYKIGQVRSISLIEKDGKNQVLVKFLITEEIAIPRASTLQVISLGLLNEKAIEVRFSKNKEVVQNGDTLPSDTEKGLKESFTQQIEPPNKQHR